MTLSFMTGLRPTPNMPAIPLGLSPSFLILSICVPISLWNAGHNCRRFPIKYVSMLAVGQAPCPSSPIRFVYKLSFKRIMLRRATGGRLCCESKVVMKTYRAASEELSMLPLHYDITFAYSMQGSYICFHTLSPSCFLSFSSLRALSLGRPLFESPEITLALSSSWILDIRL